MKRLFPKLGIIGLIELLLIKKTPCGNGISCGATPASNTLINAM
jgi:hypothetical protein